MIDPQERALALLASCDRTAELEKTDSNRVPDMIVEHRMLREMLREQLAFQQGFKSEWLRLIDLVYSLLGAVTSSSGGSANWMTELPPGKAPAVRRALNRLIVFFRGIE